MSLTFRNLPSLSEMRVDITPYLAPNSTEILLKDELVKSVMKRQTMISSIRSGKLYNEIDFELQHHIHAAIRICFFLSLKRQYNINISDAVS